MIKELLLADLKSFYRNPGILFWTFGFPILLSLILGLAFSTKQDLDKKIGVIDNASYKYIQDLNKKQEIRGPYSKFLFIELNEEDAILRMKRGEISLYININPNKKLNYHFDPNNTDSFLTYLQLKQGISDPLNEFENEIVKLESPGTRYIDFLLPGLLAMGIMNTCLWGSAWTLIEFRIKKLLRRLMSTPLSKPTFLITHIFIRYILGGFEFMFLALFGYFIFSVKLQGSLIALFLVYTSGIISFSGIAITLSSRTANNQIANGLINSVSMPMMITSGIFFSYHNFPEYIEKIVKYFPLTLLADSVRGIFIEGKGVGDILIPIIILNIIGIIFFYIGLKNYKWD